MTSPARTSTAGRSPTGRSMPALLRWWNVRWAGKLCRPPSKHNPAAGLWLGLMLAALAGPGRAQVSSPVPMTVDREGVMRWTDTKEEVALFGVNYSTPFAHAYRAHAQLGIDHKQAIDHDLLHLARLGLDAYRIHVWDREVSDQDGNLIENAHLDLLDFVMARLIEYDIKAILTPIAWWPTGYPEPDPGTQGLSDPYTKGQMTTLPEARRAQANYLAQFVRHVNPYTGLSYAEDQNLLAIEIINEPSHPGGPRETTRYIDAMARALREAGFRKPIFYNISQNYTDEHGRAVCRARIDGVSHQWYPTGLVRNGAVGGNMLPNVDRYPIPYEGFPECQDKARMVYEFDAADVAGSYMYPAMARSFRAAGFQWATQFAYDPMAMAYANTEYQTHYLNLVYTPGKALSFMIAGAVFRLSPRKAVYGTYPKSAQWAPFRVSYAEDLSEMLADTAFFYSNDTRTAPPSPELLRHVAGVGSSAVVDYQGTGAYFLDRLADGIWRLELYPDVAWLVDPFTRPSLEREAARVIWRSRPMRVTLPDLGPSFTVEPVDHGNRHRPAVTNGSFDARPGAYLLVQTGKSRPSEWTPETVVAGRRLGAFVAPLSSDGPTIVNHIPPTELTAGRGFTVEAEVVSASPPDSVRLFVRRVGGRDLLRLAMEPAGGFGYRVQVPHDQVRQGLMEYAVTLYTSQGARTYPAHAPGDPSHWDYVGREAWRVPVVAAGAPILLFDTGRDLDHLLYPHPWEYVPFRTDIVSGTEPGRLALQAVVEDLSPPPHHLALRTFLPEGQRTRLDQAAEQWVLRIRARSAGQSADRMEIGLVERDGSAWGTTIDLTDRWREVVVPVSALRPIALALLPRPYPQFLPYLWRAETGRTGVRLQELDGLQFAVARDAFPNADGSGEHGFEIEGVVLDLGP